MKTFRLLLVGALGSVSVFGNSFALVVAPTNDVDWDTVFSQENKAEVIKTLNDQQKKVATTTSLTCDNMYQLIKDSSTPRMMPYYNDMVMETTSAQSISVKGASTQSSRTADASSSKTNTQIAGIDETDVIKVVGSNVYFANAKDSKLMNYQINKVGKPILVQWLKLPSGLSNPQFLQDGPNLIVIGSMYNDADNGTIYDSSSQTLVLQYKIDNGQLTATRAFRLQGNYVDSRLEGSKLTLVQTQYTRYVESGVDTKKLAWNLGASIIYNPDNGETTKTNSVIGCDKVQSFVGSTGTSAHITLIRSLNLNDGTFAAQSAYLGSFGTLYLDQQGIIGTVTVDRPYTWCNGLARCAMPAWQNNGQMIVTFEQHNGVWTMSAATPIIGYVPGQYAIGRRPDGGHVVVTSDWNNGARTNVFSIGRNGVIRDAIINVAPRESFQSARTIGSKLYLVTFEQTDPLFVINIGNPEKLTILGELVIPGFSSYLHPYAPEANGKQYLIGLGQGPVSGNLVTTKVKGKTITRRLPDEQGVKLDLYEIDYNKVIGGKISTKQVTSLRVGGEGTTTPALYDPRTFVWNDVTKQVYLPLSRLTWPSNNQIVCMGIGVCPPVSNQPIHHFYGYKIFKASPSGIKLTADVDLKSSVKGLIDNTSNDIQSLHYDTMRIGFVNNSTFIINNHFMGTVLGGAKQFVKHISK